MSVNILMPALSPTMEKGNLAKWLKKEGDRVKAGDVIAEIETDKATMEVEAVDEGTLGKIVVPEGTPDVPVNQVIAVLLQEDEDASKISTPAAAKPTAKAEPKSIPKTQATSPSPQRGEGAGQVKAPTQSTPFTSPRGGEVAARRAAGEGATNGSGKRSFSSPLARRLAKEAGIELARVQGSGPRGRIVARDIEAAKGGAPMRALAPAAARPTELPSGMPDEKIRALFKEGSYEFVPHDLMRKAIARRLTESKLTIPHYYLTIDCQIDELMKAREEINSSAAKGADGKPRFKLSVNDFVIKALALALIQVPDANVSWLEAGMLRHKHADVGVAVAIQGGLITPIIRHAEEKTLGVISNEMRDLSQRARNRKLKPHEYEGGSAAVSNLGMYGVKEFAAVINPPQASILAVGAGEERAVVKNGKLAVATVMTATLSADHRAVDGAVGAQLLAAFKNNIEKPVALLA
jgi:pyruvate dehydrogenase E2 component (dihydrolipoyllysine-residue acetyltransferase)